MQLPGNFLKELNLRGNRLGINNDCDAARALASALEHPSCQLNYLDLGFNSFSGRALEIVGRPAIFKLSELRLFNNHWDEAARRNFKVWISESQTKVDFGFQSSDHNVMNIFEI